MQGREPRFGGLNPRIKGGVNSSGTMSSQRQHFPPSRVINLGPWSNPLIGSAYHMELRHLRYFTAVAQWKGYREASRHLYITQPSISEAVSYLECELGIKLFSRDGRLARLTPE